jgi:serine/threonine protein kinase
MFLCSTPFKPKDFMGSSHQKMAFMRKNILEGVIGDVSGIPSGPKDLVKKLLKRDPKERLNGKEILNHQWVHSIK